MNSNNIKIAYIGGPDVSLRIPMIRMLSKNNKYIVHTLGSNIDQAKEFERKSYKFIYYPLNQGFNIFSDIYTIFKLVKIFRREKYKLIHAYDTKPLILGRIIAKLTGVKIIIGTITGMGALFSSGPNSGSCNNIILRYIYKIGQKIASGCSVLTIFQNEHDLSYFLQHGMVSNDKSVLIKGSGVDINLYSRNRFNNKRMGDLDCIDLKTDFVNIFMISRLVQYKGVREYLETSRVLRQKYNDIKFYLIGESDDTKYGIKNNELKSFEPYINFLGYRTDIPWLLNYADILVHPTYYGEGIPRVLLEAASMEVPIITTNVPGCVDIVEDGYNGLIIEPCDVDALINTLVQLYLDPTKRRDMGKNGRKKIVGEFSLDIVFGKTIEIYEKLLK